MECKTGAVMHDLQNSLKQVEKAKPIIRELLRGGEIKAVEGRDDEICLMLDQNCGTDYFQIYRKGDLLDGVVWGIGSRFQKVRHGSKTFDTFTIRKSREYGTDTEYIKRKRAIQNNGIYPYLTMHGYYDEETEEILSLAIAKTIDVWDCIDNRFAYTMFTNYNQIGQSEFYCLRWDKMLREGYPVKIWKKQQ